MWAARFGFKSMKHNQYASEFPFVRKPLEFDKNSEKEFLQFCLGGTLYMPGTREITDKILNRQMGGLTSMVMCFEDAIPGQDLERAETNVLNHLERLAVAIDQGAISTAQIPLTFLRVRNTDQFKRFVSRLPPASAGVLSGFVFPKFHAGNAAVYLEELADANARLGTRLYGMPILEGRTIAFLETRVDELYSLKTKIDPFKELILNVRVGGTDFSSIFSVRRDINTSIYNIMVVRDCLAAILNMFNREEDGYTVSAPVWEYFLAYKKEDITQLLVNDRHTAIFKRSLIINEAVDGLVRETIMDKANGFVGKTIIHPSHLPFVNAIQAVTREEYEDAMQILETRDGVIKSAQSNKMNEINPHRSWARRIARRADAYGVVENESAFLELILGAVSR